ncbi:MoaF C-terminal domain-containing protein [Arthrobacter sp. B6]|uniref:MoaF C-terminal domain-containing protein n=1 Tax=Arthrobacter sp. B6 TaxID=1570137 RepID=UPI00083315FC|nr:MoaF C-terminal domain-containing protein [Arthrobacter sp. B6]
MKNTKTPNFISVGALGEGFAANSNVLDVHEGLNGRSFTLTFADGETHDCRILGSTSLIWDGSTYEARVTSIREGIYFVDFLTGEKAKESLSVVLDDANGQVTLVGGSLPNEETASASAYDRARQGMELTGVDATILHGSLNGVQGGMAHAPTKELIGLRNRYHYSPEEAYEHLYLNENFYTWHCIKGSESGLADTDRCHYIAISEQLYLFIWREKIVPTLGVILIDLKRMKTDGKIFGYSGFDFSTYTNFPVGAVADVLNMTTY